MARHNTAAKVVVEQVDEITLDKVKVQVRAQNIPTEEILLDPTNPRLANTVAVGNFGDGQALQDALTDILWQDPDVQSLYRSILANRGLIERIIIRHNKVAAEGNCRTVVYRKLQKNF